MDAWADLRLQIEWGADEALDDLPIDRLVAPPPRVVAPAPAAPKPRITTKMNGSRTSPTVKPAPLPKLFDPYHFDQMKFRSYLTTVIPANWKVVVDAFNEFYHAPALHHIQEKTFTTVEGPRLALPFGDP